MKAKRRTNYSGFVFAIVFAIVLELLARAGWLTSYVPPPTVMFAALWHGLINGDISSQIGTTLSVYVRALALGAVLAISMGILMGTYRPVSDSLKIIVEFMRPIPSVAMIPLSILFFGLGATMRISVITYAVFWPMLINTLYGVRAIDPQALDVARNFGITGYQALLRVTLPSALSSIMTGFRISATIALIVTITTELVAGNSGIGFYISQMEQANRLPEMYGAIVLTGIMGYLLNTFYFWLEHRVIFWSPGRARKSNMNQKTTVVRPGKELRVTRLPAFRAQVSLALATADSVMVDLRGTKRVDSWALLAIIDLALTYSPRLTFVAPELLRAALQRIEPRAELADQIVSA